MKEKTNILSFSKSWSST